MIRFLLFAQANPFIEAYTTSDLIGKLIFISLLVLSILSWTLVIFKIWSTHQVQKSSQQFRKLFFQMKESPLALPSEDQRKEFPCAFQFIYTTVKKKAHELFERHDKIQKKETLSADDLEFLSSHADSAILALTTFLSKHLYLLSTIVTLAPFLGLLGTVYGILVTFTEMNTSATAASNQVVLGGLSLALTTTVIGLVDAIPALIGYTYLKNTIQEFEADMYCFANDVLGTIELKYRVEKNK